MSLESVRSWWERNSEGWTGIVLYAALGVIAALFLNSFFGIILGTQVPVVTVSTTSMVPTLQVGDLVVVKGEEAYEPGDIVVFAGWEDRPIIHRVVARYDGGEISRYSGWNGMDARKLTELSDRHGYDTFLITKGDNNPTCDQCQGKAPVEPSSVHGRTLTRIPFLGYVKLYALKTGSVLGVV